MLYYVVLSCDHGPDGQPALRRPRLRLLHGRPQQQPSVSNIHAGSYFSNVEWVTRYLFLFNPNLSKLFKHI